MSSVGHVPAALEALEDRLLLASGPIISELLAVNPGAPGLADEDGDYSDWIEIHNPTDSSIDLVGWHLTDDDDDLSKWTFPAVAIDPGEYLVVFASDKDRDDPAGELHTSFCLDGDGEYLALVDPDATSESYRHEYAPGYPEQRADISYGVAETWAERTLVAPGSVARTFVPGDDSLGRTWVEPAFDASGWPSGLTGIGFDADAGASQPQLLAYWAFDETTDGGATAPDATGTYDGAIYGASPTTGGGGRFGEAMAFDGDNDYVDAGVIAEMVAPAAFSVSVWFRRAADRTGDATNHGVNNILVAHSSNANNDNFELGTEGANVEVYLDTADNDGPNPSIREDVGVANDAWHHVALTYDQARPDEVKLYFDGLPPREYSAWGGNLDASAGSPLTIGMARPDGDKWGDFEGLIDDVALWDGALSDAQIAALFAGGSPLDITGFDNLIQTDLQSQLYQVGTSAYSRIDFEIDQDPQEFDALTLRVKYDDGFAAYLNGVEVASANAPDTPAFNSTATAPHPDSQAVVFEDIYISDHLDLLVAGANVLAVHTLSVSADDTDMLMLPVLVAATDLGYTGRYYATPTPREPNNESFLGLVADTKFSVDRGFFDEPFSLKITTDTSGATIRYTTDGSEPTETHGTEYLGPVTIDRTTVLRAAAFKMGYEPSDVDTQTYIFLADVLTQSPGGQAPGPGWPTGSVNGQVINYGMDPDVANHATWGPQLEEALTSIPTMSLVTDLDNLFDPATGIYVNAGGHGYGWERPTSLELIYPDDAGGPGFPDGADEGFQVNAGLRIRGGFSRSDANPKHAFRLFFRDEYGDAKLEYPLFGDEGVDAFDKIDLRTSQNYSWSFQGDGRNTMNRDVFSRDAQREMGQPYTRSRYYHLYINGHYWGLFQTQERSEAAFGEAYFEGDRDNYDTVKCTGSSGGYTTEATDGNLDAWRDLWDEANAGFAADEAYLRVQGLNPDGTRNPEYPVYVDVDNLIDYMIVIVYGGNLDAPISNFLSNTRPNNWYGIRDRTGEEAFIYFAHDAEHTLLNVNQNRNGPWPAGDEFRHSNPQWLHQELMAHPEYRTRFADHVQEYFFNGGLLTPEGATDLFMSRANEIDMAIIAESARWGDAKRSTPFTKNDWLNAINNIVDNYFPQRTGIVLNQFRNTKLRDGSGAPLYPSVDAPAFDQHGGQVDAGFHVLMGAPAGRIYFTLDGTDPRLWGGGLSPGAHLFNDSTITTTLVPKGATWKYLDDGSDQGTAWYGVGFDDASWESGPAQLGYGDNGEVTTVSYGPDPENKHITTYFRTTFDVTGLSEITDLTLSVVRDDGAVVYINGQEIDPRSNMPAGPIDYQTAASGVVSGGDETKFFDIDVGPGVLVEGENVIAVGIHQVWGTSSDLSFDLKLEADRFISGTEIVLNESTVVNARSFHGGVWSALNRGDFFVGPQAGAGSLAVTEINYHPYDPTPAELAVDPNFEQDSFEFIELENISDESIEINGVQFIRGITFDFSAGSVGRLAPGGAVVAVRDPAAFAARYGSGINVAGRYDGFLRNEGERITLMDRLGERIVDSEYDDTDDWPGRADGTGSSLEVIDVAGDYSDPDNWRSSTEYGGSPGAEGQGPAAGVVVNEVLTHTDPPQVDSIELYNPTAQSVDISGWLLSDSRDNFRKFQIPEGTAIPAGGYRVFDEDDFYSSGGVDPNDFGLNGAHGDDVWLLEADADGKLTRFVDHAEFGAAANGESFGRWPNGSGGLWPMLTATLGGANHGPRVGPVVLNEVHYNPGSSPEADDLEFLEIWNPTPSAVDLTGWRIRKGVDYDFAGGTAIGPLETLVVLPFDPDDPDNADRLSDFRTAYGIDASVRLVGGYSGRLADDGEKVQLQRPDEPPLDEPDFTPHLLEDEVDYDDEAPWPGGAAGNGHSLQRVGPGRWGGAAAGWTSADPTPGWVGETPPTALAGADQEVLDADGDWSEAVTLDGSASTDVEGLVSHVWAEDGTEIATSANPTVELAVGSHAIDLTVTDTGGRTHSDRVEVFVAPHLNGEPLVLISPVVNREVPSGDTYPVQWYGGDDETSVRLWGLHLGGWQVLAEDLPGTDGGFNWDTNGTPPGWYSFNAEVHRNGHTTHSSSRAWVALHNGHGAASTGMAAPAGSGEQADSSAPLAGDDPSRASGPNGQIETTRDTSVTSADLLANDVDPDGGPLEVVAQHPGVAPPGPLTPMVTYAGAGQFTYTPNAGFVGTDLFTYEISDSAGGIDLAEVTVLVSAA